MKKTWLKRALCGLLSAAVCLGGLSAGAITVEEARELLLERYVDEVPAAALEQETVEATVDALGDPYSFYLLPEEVEELLNTGVDETVVGIGVVISPHDDGVEIIRVEAGGPAEEAGLRAGDILVAADGTELKGLDMDATAELVRGAEGTQVSLTYLRDGLRRTVRVTRRAVVIAATRGGLLEGCIGYIQCDSFGSDTAGHFRELMEQMDAEAKVWAIDLRGNPGGTVGAVGEVGSLFAGPGAYIALQEKDGTRYYYGAETEAVTDKPVIILVNGGSASASEAVTAALREYCGALVIGERTFGKGIAQDVFYRESDPELFPDGDGIKLTTARFFSPYGNTNDSLGVLPGLTVDGDLAAEVLKLLGPTWSGTACGDPLSFTLNGAGRYTADLAPVKEDEDSRRAAEALVSALAVQGYELKYGGKDVEFSALARAVEANYGLELSVHSFPDGEEGTVCDGSVYDLLYTHELVAGKDDGLFHPGDHLTRGELCQLMAAALQCRVPTNPCPFPDVDEEAWYARAVTALYNRGMVKGDGDGLFHPEEEVDHQQFFTVMGRLFAWLNCEAETAFRETPEEELGLRVLRGYDPWARRAVWLLSCAPENMEGGVDNLLWDEPENIDPHTLTTRDEAAAVLYQMLNYLGML